MPVRVLPAFAAILGGAAALAAPAAAEEVRLHGAHVDLRCQQVSYRLDCDYRPRPPAEVQAVRASAGEVTLPAPTLEPLSPASSTVAVMMLVDTSDPRREAAVAAARRHVRALIAAGGTNFRFALARFDSDLDLLAPLGSDADTVRAAADRLEAVGPTTELYRNALAAVRLLAEYPADRRALLLFSDGLAEDSAYFHEDVVRAADASGVAVFGLGYPRSVARSVALQSLRRLAEETGGRFVAADAAFELPESFLATPFASLAGGGRMTLDLEALRGQNPGALSLSMTWVTTEGESALSMALALPTQVPEPVVKVVEIEVPKVVEVPKLIEVPAEPATPSAAQAPAAPAPPPATALPPHGWLWYAMLVLGVLTVLMLVLVMVRLSRRPGGSEATAEHARDEIVEDAKSERTIAFLVPEDGMGDENPITKPHYRIGRQADNDLMLTDPSISRHHAEIHRERDGSFNVVDLDSMNGVFVNGKKARTAPLDHGDLVELGDVAMHFTLRVLEEELPGEETVILRTVVPDVPLPGDNDMDDPRPIRRVT